MILTHEQAIGLVDEMVQNINLKRHMYCVEAAMRTYAQKYKQNADAWGLAGLLHDADWGQYPNEHPAVIVKRLRAENVDEDIIHAIASHGNNSPDFPNQRFEERTSLMDKALFACDEMSGFIIACALIRPDRLDSLGSDSVIKKMKDKSFAANVKRTDLLQGASELDVELPDHINTIIEALKGIRDSLGF